MKILLLLILLTTFAFSQTERFTTEHFIQKHGLQIPAIVEENIDISQHTHKSDSWRYFYKSSSKRVDSVYRHLNIEGFAESKRYEKHTHRGDTVFIERFSISQRSHDTTTSYFTVITDNHRKEKHFDKLTNCLHFIKFTHWGRRIEEKRQCPGDEEPQGQEFTLYDRGEYIESVEAYKGQVDSNTIRRIYFNSFDSVVADYFVEGEREPVLLALFDYWPSQMRKAEYNFDTFSSGNLLIYFNFHTYTKDNKPKRNYFFQLRDHDSEKGYELINYTEYTYDSLGRKVSVITRVPPDEKE